MTSVKKGDHVIPLYTPECRQCPSCLSRKTNLCTAIRATQGQGVMPDGTSRFSLAGKKLFHYMGTSTFANHTVLPEIAVAKIREDAPFDKVCYIGCGVTTGIGAVLNTAKVEPGAKAIVFGLGGIGLNVIQGLKLAGADMIIGVDINNDKKAWGERFGMTHFVNPKEAGGDLVAHLVNMTKKGADQIGGADYTFDCTGNVTVMRQALEACHRGWGVSVIIGVAGAGQEIATRPFQLVTGRVWKGTAFGGARGRTDVPKIVDWYMEKKIQIDPMITHTMPLARHQQRLRSDARRARASAAWCSSERGAGRMRGASHEARPQMGRRSLAAGALALVAADRGGRLRPAEEHRALRLGLAGDRGALRPRRGRARPRGRAACLRRKPWRTCSARWASCTPRTGCGRWS